MGECETCGYEVHEDNMPFECECGEVVCHECCDEHAAGCSEFVAARNDEWGPTTPAGSLL